MEKFVPGTEQELFPDKPLLLLLPQLPDCTGSLDARSSEVAVGLGKDKKTTKATRENPKNVRLVLWKATMVRKELLNLGLSPWP